MSDQSAYWDQRYSERGYLWGIEANRFLVEVASGFPPGTALDLGCGQGRNSVWLATLGHVVTGYDLSPVAITQARRLAEEAGVDVDFHAVDLATWDPAGRTWDLVVLSYLQVPDPLRRTIHEKAVEALAPAGRIVLVAHHRDNLEHGIGGPQSPEVLYTEDDLRDDFAGVHIYVCERVLRPVEGDDVSGYAIDVLFVAAKPT